MLERYHARPDEPPKGGIFLSHELYTPPEIEQLIDRLPDYRQESAAAQRELSDLFRANEEMTSNERYARHLQFVREEIIGKIRGGIEPKPEALAYAGNVERLQEHAGLYQDASSAISRQGNFIAGILAKDLTDEPQTVGNHSYRIWYDDRLYRKQWHLIGFDETSGTEIIFNYWEKIITPRTRAAQVGDCIRVIYDVAAAQVRLGVVLSPAEEAPTEPDPPTVFRNKERLLANAAYAYSHCFWLQNRDLLRDGSGEITRRSLDDESDGGGKKLKLDFISNERNHRYLWQLTTSSRSLNRRQVVVISVTPETVQAREFYFGNQGQLIKSENVDAGASFETVFELAEHDNTKREMQEMRERVAIQRELVGAFGAKAVLQPAASSHTYAPPPAYVSRLDQQAESIKMAGMRPAQLITQYQRMALPKP